MKSEVEKFVEYWRENSDLIIETEFQPQHEAYENADTDLSLTAWLKENRLENFRGDLLIDNRLIVEFNGTGGKYSHRAAGAERDYRKNNQNLKLGYVTATYSIQTLKNSHSFVFDDINDILEVI